MKKHLVLKASILLIVMFFHSFVLVPRANASTWEGIAGRLAFRAYAPSVIAALGSGTALVLGAVVAGGIGYLIYKSNAVTALKNWFNSYRATVDLPAFSGNSDFYYGTSKWVNVNNGTASGFNKVNGSWVWQIGIFWNPPGDYEQRQMRLFLYGSETGGSSTPTVPTDYVIPLVTTQPSFPSNSVYGTPGAASAILGGAAIISAVTMSDSDADRFVTGAGGSVVASDGSQVANPNAPTANDNTLTAGDSTIAGLLQSMLNYLSNLLGIKTSIDSVKTGTDCVVALTNTMNTTISSQAGKLDNIATLTNIQNAKMDNMVSVGIQQKATLDNIMAMTNTQTTAINDTKTAVQNLDNTISVSTATSGSVASRISALETAASTKFPFSLASSLSVAPVSGSSSYVFASLPLTPSLSIPIAPMAGPLNTLFSWIRQLLVWFFWAGTLLAMLRKGMAM